MSEQHNTGTEFKRSVNSEAEIKRSGNSININISESSASIAIFAIVSLMIGLLNSNGGGGQSPTLAISGEQAASLAESLQKTLESVVEAERQGRKELIEAIKSLQA